MKPYRSVATKLWLLFAGISVAGVVLLMFVAYSVYDAVYVDAEREQLHELAEALRGAYLAGDEEKLEGIIGFLEDSGLDALAIDDPMVLGAALPLQAPEGDVIINFEEREQLAQGEAVVIERRNAYVDADLVGVALPVIESGNLRAIVFAYRPVSELSQAFMNVLPILAVSGLLALAALYAIRRRIQKEFIGPVVELRNASDAMAKGRFEGAVKASVHNEVGDLGQSFSAMAASIREEDEKKREFLQNLSHELRTPLSYMKGYSELLQQPDADYRNIAAILYRESERMERMVSQILDLTKLEGGNEEMAYELLALSEIALSAIDNTAVKWRGKQQRLEADLDEELLVYGDEDRLLQVLVNLLDNAIAYTPQGGSIAVSLRKEGEEAVLEVNDNGPGIPEQHLPHVAERFYRVEKGRTRAGGGAGIGLSIVKGIAEMHGGRLEVESSESGGTCVQVRLPMAVIS
ncbi:sensor histidine kinase [Planococcus koreensis]|uniref:sensor histidine kinase n=1 Tax=Planococcus koreensis TaxID=112331 RepID=UPI0039FDCCCD